MDINECGIIYKVTNLINKKCYIGFTKESLDIRKKAHLYTCALPRKWKSKFYNALRKYPPEHWKWELLYKDIPKKYLRIAEICAIYVSNSYYNGYNSTLGGDGLENRHTHSAKEKMSLAVSKAWQDGKYKNRKPRNIYWINGMPRLRTKTNFKTPKMFSARVEELDFYKFEKIMKYRDNLTLQEFVNVVIENYISGSFLIKDGKVKSDG